MQSWIYRRFVCYDIRSPDKRAEFLIIFLTSQPKQTYVVGTQKNRLNETVLLSTHNTC